LLYQDEGFGYSLLSSTIDGSSLDLSTPEGIEGSLAGSELFLQSSLLGK